MQWDSSKNAGFSEAEETWLPLAKNYTDCNVELQEKVDRSILKNFRELTELRENPTMKYGELQIVAIDEEIMAYKREIEGDPAADVVVVVLNLVDIHKTVNLQNHLTNLPEEMQISIVSIHSKTLKTG